MSNAKSDPVVFEFPAKPEYLVQVRQLIERLGGQSPLNRQQLDDLLTAVDEAAANAIRHGSPKGKDSLVKITCRAVPGGLLVEVRDTGPGFSISPSPGMPSPEATGGRGLPMMCALADSVEIASAPEGTTVTLRKSANR